MNIGGAKMLIRFNVKNFLSFFENESGQSEEFSMIAGKVRASTYTIMIKLNCSNLQLFMERMHLENPI